MVNTDNKVARVLTDTEGLISMYQKKIGQINKSVEKTNIIKEEIRYKQKETEKKLDKIDVCCSENHAKTVELMEQVASQYQEYSIDQGA